jgi:hypothetical protein
MLVLRQRQHVFNPHPPRPEAAVESWADAEDTGVLLAMPIAIGDPTE